MKTILLTILAVISTFSARGEPTGKNVQELLRTIRSKIPEGWTASYQKQYSWLEISRRKSVLGDYPAPSCLGDYPQKNMVRGRVSFSFRITEGVSPVEYKRMSVENAPVLKNLNALTADLEKRNVRTDKDGSYVPRTDPDKQLVDQYNALKKTLHHVPGYYFRNISLDLEGFPGEDSFSFIPQDNQVLEECGRVRKTLIKLLSKYEEVQQPTDGRTPEGPQTPH